MTELEGLRKSYHKQLVIKERLIDKVILLERQIKEYSENFELIFDRILTNTSLTDKELERINKFNRSK